jgi:hypothetical protein
MLWSLEHGDAAMNQDLINCKRAESIAAGLAVRLDGNPDDSKVVCFATVVSRDEFIARAKRLGRTVEVV